MKKLLATLAVCAVTMAASGPANAEDTLTRGDVETIIQEYLLDNPEILRDAFEELERREIEAANRARSEAVTRMSDVLLNSTRQVELGNPDGNVTMVEFFDYNCGYCRRAMADMMRLIEEDPDLRIVLKEFPVLGQASVEAAQVAIAVNLVAPEKYMDFHTILMEARGRATGASALEAAVSIGLDQEAIETAMGDTEVGATLEEVALLSRHLGINGTPAYVVGDEVLMGAVGFDRLKAQIDDTRNCGEATC